MNKFLELRSKVEFQNTLDKHAQFRVYNAVLKSYGELDDETRKFVDMDMHMFLIKRNIKYTAHDGDENRFDFATPYSEEAIELYEMLGNESELDVVRYLYWDYLVEYGDKAKKYKYALQLVNELKTIITHDSHKEHELVNVISRYLDVVLSFKIKGEVEHLATSMLKRIEYLYSNKEYRYMIEYAEFTRVLYSKFVDEKEIIDVSNTILKPLDDARNYYLAQYSEYLVEGFSSEYRNWLKLLKLNSEVIDEVMFDYAEMYEKLAKREEESENPSNFRVAHFLENALKIYLDHGRNKKAKELQVRIKNAYGIYTKEEMSSIPFEFGIPIDHLERRYSRYIGDSIEETFQKFSLDETFIPSIGHVKNEAIQRKNSNHLSDMVTKSLMDADRKVFQELSDEDKKKFIFYEEYLQHLIIPFALYYDYAFYNLKAEGLDKEQLIKRITQWEYFDGDTITIIERGLYYYWEEDYIAALSILVPQFEDAVRYFFHMGGKPTTVIRDGVTQQVQVFGTFLDLEVVKEAFGEDLTFMMKFFLVEERGINLRNKIAHGLAKLGEFRKNYADIIIFLFFTITNLGWKPAIKEGDEVEGEA